MRARADVVTGLAASPAGVATGRARRGGRRAQLLPPRSHGPAALLEEYAAFPRLARRLLEGRTRRIDMDNEFRSASRAFNFAAIVGAVTSIGVVLLLVWGAIEIAKMFAK